MTKFFVNRANASQLESPRTIDEDRACDNCGYNLRGLKTSGRCPECGTPIRRRRSTATERDFCDLPPSTIRRLTPGFYLATLSVLGIALLAAGGFFWSWPAKLFIAVALGCAFTWFIALWLMTVPIELPGGTNRGFARSSRLRLAARWLQLGWFVQAGAVWLDVTSAAPGPALRIIGGAGNLAGVIGIILLAYLLANFAEWVRDDFAEKCFNFTFGGLAIVTPLMLLVIPFFKTFLPAFIVLVLIAWFFWFGSVIAFPLGLWSLSRSLAWAVYHSKQKLARQLRDAAKVVTRPHVPPQPQEDPSASIPLTDEHAADASIRHDSVVQVDPQRPAEAIRRRGYTPGRGASSGGDPADMEVF